MYFNTTNEKGGTLKQYQKKAMTQDEKVLLIFKEADTMLTPFQVLMKWKAKYHRPSPPLTSIRRAINTLTKYRKLVKTNKKGVGAYGRPVHYWRLANELDQ